MKKIFILTSILLINTLSLQAQNDTIYFWKGGILELKKSIKAADLDSITFKRPVATIPNVTICTQVWATKNMNVTTYSDGTHIPEETDPTAWTNLTTGAWCHYNNDPANDAIYGKLYNWYAIAGIYDAASLADPLLRKKITTTGWHIPTDAEWNTLITCLGGISIAGGKMKATTVWDSPNTDATNSSGFTGFPGGIRYDYNSGLFNLIGSSGGWWSSTESGVATEAWCRNLDYASGRTYRDAMSKQTGFSVRCLKD
jgi:uncharacterized protein (TIGR02145 family)